MKYNKRTNIYNASNVRFDENNQTAWSFDWWCFFKHVNGIRVFNDYCYSGYTSRHQGKVWKHLNYAKDIISIQCPAGLQASDWKTSSLEHYTDLINELKRAIAKPKSRKSTNENRQEQIKRYESKILIVTNL